jgi:DNA-binding LacI/PurR family transcriptional regulator
VREPTMADIAAYLGVSRQLVSIVLRDMPGASEETRRRVIAAAAELGYSLNLGARTLRQSRSRQIGVSFAPVHATEPETLETIYPVAAASGYQVVLSAQTATRGTRQSVEELLTYRCAAIIVIGSDLPAADLGDLAQRAKVPLIAVGVGGRSGDFDVIRSAGDEGLALLTRHLIGLGHQRIAYVHSPGLPVATTRRRGYLSVIRAAGLAEDVVTTDGPDYTEEAGAAAGRRLLTRAALPTAVMAANDQAASGLLQTLTRAGIRVPADVSVTGFDDSWFARLSFVDLTTARQAPDLMGAAAVRAAVRRIDRPTVKPAVTVIPTELVLRSSTATPRCE